MKITSEMSVFFVLHEKEKAQERGGGGGGGTL